MCVIVDTNAFSDVFLESSAQHKQFKPVKKFIDSGKSKIIIGGTTYIKELKHALLLVEMSREGKVVRVSNDQLVDVTEKDLKVRYPESRFDDPHIVALAIVSHAKLVCTHDGVLQTYLKNKDLFPKGVARPSIYNERTRPDALPSRGYRPRCLLCR